MFESRKDAFIFIALVISCILSIVYFVATGQVGDMIKNWVISTLAWIISIAFFVLIVIIFRKKLGLSVDWTNRAMNITLVILWLFLPWALMEWGHNKTGLTYLELVHKFIVELSISVAIVIIYVVIEFLGKKIGTKIKLD